MWRDISVLLEFIYYIILHYNTLHYIIELGITIVDLGFLLVCLLFMVGLNRNEIKLEHKKLSF